jgi:flavin reductase ActVB
VTGPADFRGALSRFASGVTIVTARDAAGAPHGFTASAFCSVSLDPPLVCVCVARTARCHPVFAARDELAISILRPGHAGLALRFATRSPDKFAAGGFRATAAGHLVVDGALAVLECGVHGRYEAGDHTMLVAAVHRAEWSDGEPLLFYDRTFGTVAAGRT